MKIAALLAALCVLPPAAHAGEVCTLYSADFEGFSDPPDVDGPLARVTWCMNGATVAGASFCPNGGALRLDEDSDEPLIRVEPMGNCTSVTLRFNYSQFAITSTFVLYEITGGAAPNCDGGAINLAGFPSTLGGICTPFEHTVFLFPGQSVSWRIDHGGPANTAFFLDDLEVTATGCCSPEHACCESGSAGCADDAIAACVCAVDPFCCDVAWDEQCIAEVETLGCGSCADPGGACAETWSTDFGTFFQSGTVCSLFPDLFESCDGNGPFLTAGTACGGSGDMAMSFASGLPYSSATTRCLDLTAAGAASLAFTWTKSGGTLGPRIEIAVADAAFATIWSAPVNFNGGCVTEQLDLGAWLGASEVRLRFVSGSSISNGAAFDDLALVTSTSHDCCVAGDAGCNDATSESCVCAIDPFCCDEVWDEFCVLENEFFGCGDCGICTDAIDLDFGTSFISGSICDLFPEAFSACAGNGPYLTTSGACAGPGDAALRLATGGTASTVDLRCLRLAKMSVASLSFRYAKTDDMPGPFVSASVDGGSAFTSIFSAPLAPGPGCHDACIDLTEWAGNPFLVLRIESGGANVGDQWIDDLVFWPAACPVVVFGDLDGDGNVGFGDLILLLAAWGPCPADCPADLDRDGTVGFADLLALLSAFG